ncbi:MAG: glycosyltransferase [TACK group archaeon]|nr:glycosyltransferase [TACK group archaeon]
MSSIAHLLPMTEFFLLAVAYVLFILSSLILVLPKKVRHDSGTDYKPVTLLIPVYNEGKVAARSIESVSGLNYPKELVEVLVLDDSDDPESVKCVEEAVAQLVAKGYRASVERRKNRVGGKAGFLREIHTKLRTPYAFLLDSDFRLNPDALSSAVWACESTGASYCQLAWSLEGSGPVAKLQQSMLEYHLKEEQERAVSRGLPVKINGSCVLINNRDLSDVGGWSAGTVTEDLDLTVRFALSGKKGTYLPLVGGTGLATPSFSSLFKQIKRWVIGNAQCMLRYGGNVLKAGKKIDSIISFSYLFNYFFSISYMLILAAVLINLATKGNSWFYFFSLLPAVLLLAVSISRKYFYPYLTSFAYSTFIAVFFVEGLFRKRYGFVRTKKVREQSDALGKTVVMIFALGFLAAFALALVLSKFCDAALLLAYAISFLFVAAFW